MMLPKVGDKYPARVPHDLHRAVIAAVDTHGVPSWADEPDCPPTILVRCSCGAEWLDSLPEAVAV